MSGGTYYTHGWVDVAIIAGTVLATLAYFDVYRRAAGRLRSRRLRTDAYDFERHDMPSPEVMEARAAYYRRVMRQAPGAQQGLEALTAYVKSFGGNPSRAPRLDDYLPLDPTELRSWWIMLNHETMAELQYIADRTGGSVTRIHAERFEHLSRCFVCVTISYEKVKVSA